MSQEETEHLEVSQQLLQACVAGQADAVCQLLEQGADPAFADDNSITCLMHAAENGHKDVVTLLLENGAPWNAQDKDGYCAGEYASGSKHRDIVELLMDWGVQSELLLGAMERQKLGSGAQPASNSAYLQQKLHYVGEKLLDADGEAVMMGWEKPLMLQHAQVICANGGDILNIGFGLGIVDTAIQSHNPRTHTIIEAHPDVYAHMLEQGWGQKPNVRILFGRWQDVLPQLGQYDGIFFDTYGEYYEELHDFHQQLPQLLKPTGIYSFFNGLASDNIFFHLVYGRLVQVELSALGLSTRYQPLSLPALDATVWEGVKNKYWHFESYFLPVCQLDPDLANEAGPPQENKGGNLEPA